MIFGINGRDFSSDVAYSIEGNDLDSENSGRGEDGVMFRERVRTDVKSVPFSLYAIPSVTARAIKQELQRAASISVTYQDIEGEVTISGYVSVLSRTPMSMKNGAPDTWNMNFTVVEN